MTKNNDDMYAMEDIWEKYVDLDEQIFMNENPLDAKLRGRAFSPEDRTKLKNVIKRIIEKMLLPFIEKKIRTLE